MSGYIRLKTTIPNDNGLAEDAVVWTTHWIHANDTDTPSDVALAAITNMTAFIQAVGYKLASTYDPAHPDFKAYNLLDPEPRIPLFHSTPTVSLSGSQQPNDLPAEVAVCISYQAAPVSGTNQRRRRGRIYFGPVAVNTTGDPDSTRYPNVLVDELATAAWNNFVIPAGSKGLLAVFSGYTATDTPVGEQPAPGEDYIPELVPGSFVKVDQLWVDNAWDTQRRRGLKSTYRKAFA